MSTTNYTLLQLNYLYSLFHNENNFKNIFEKGVESVESVQHIVFTVFLFKFFLQFSTFSTLQFTTKRVHGLYFFKFDLVVKIPYISFHGK
jgi:hypothetical protein